MIHLDSDLANMSYENNKHENHHSGITTEKVSLVFIRIIFMCKDQFNIVCLAESHTTVAR